MAYLAILLVAVTGNSFVIHVARKLLSAGRGPFNILVINIAASDILYAMTVVPEYLTDVYTAVWFSREFGTSLCTFSHFALKFFVSSSILTPTTMTIDRYLAIVPVVKRPLNRQNVLKVVFGILFFFFGYSSINLFRVNAVSHVYSEGKLTFCYAVYSGEKDVDDKLRKAECTLTFIFLYMFFQLLLCQLCTSLLFGFCGYEKYQETEPVRMKTKEVIENI